MNDPVLSILCNTFPSVATLQLQVKTLAYDNSANLVHFLCAFSHLRTLEIFSNILVDLPRPRSSNLSTHLRHLILDGGVGATRLLEWFISLPDRPALRTLDFRSVDEDDLDTIVRVCSLLEDTLESLSFVVYTYTVGGALSVFIVDNLIDLRCMGLGLHCQVDLGRIRSLRIRLIARHRGYIRWIARTLSRISSIHVDEIVLEFDGDPDSEEWLTIDDVLQQETFSRLSKFEIRFQTSTTTRSRIPDEEKPRLFMENLPQCNARGILCIRPSRVPC